MIDSKEAKIIHDILIDKFGGTKGTRDEGALESALSRQYNGRTMTVKKIILTFYTAAITSFCFSQTDNNMVDTSKMTSFLFKPANFSLFSYSLYTHRLYTSGKYKIRIPLPTVNYADTLLKRPVYYNLFTGRDFSYKFNPLNPWGASDPYDAIMSGSLNFLIQAADRRYFFNKKNKAH